MMMMTSYSHPAAVPRESFHMTDRQCWLVACHADDTHTYRSAVCSSRHCVACHYSSLVLWLLFLSSFVMT